MSAFLREVCELKYGKSLPEAKRTSGPIPVFGSNGSVGTHIEALTSGPTIIIGRKGSIGEITYSPEPCWPIDTTYYVDASATSQNIRWLYFALLSLRLTELNKATGVPGLSRSDAYECKLFVPPLEKQACIGAILDKADSIRHKCAQAITSAEQFLKSAYVHTVGHLSAGYDTWKPLTIEHLAAARKGSIRSGPFGSALRHSEFVEKGIAVLGIDNAVQNEFAWGERRFITREKYNLLRRYKVFPRDVIITIMGTTGRSAVVPEDIPEAITTKHLATISCNTDLIIPEVLSFAIHSDPMVIGQIVAHNKGAIMDGLNLGIIRSLIINCPPMEEQLRFVKILKRIRKMQNSLRRPDADGSDLFCSLSQRAFRGEL